MMNETNTTTNKSANVKAIIRYHADYAIVLCPNGHVITDIPLTSQFGGSRAHAELSARDHGYANTYDRMAQSCALQDSLGQTLHEELK